MVAHPVADRTPASLSTNAKITLERSFQLSIEAADERSTLRRFRSL